MLKKIYDFIRQHIDFKFYGASCVSLFVFLSIFPMLKFMPEKYGYENGLLENIQMCVLFLTVYFCLSSKVNKKLFNFIVLVLSILIIREVNCGRTLFFPIEGAYHQYYSWKDLPWPWLGKVVHGVYGSWIAVVALLFFKNKIYINLWNTIKNIKFPAWNMLFGFIGIFSGAVAERLTNNNFIFEEGFELLFYSSMAGVVWLYSRNKNFVLEEEKTD